MAAAWRCLMPASILLTSRCSSLVRGAALVDRLCASTPIKTASHFARGAARSRASLSVSAMANPIVIPPHAEHCGTVIMLHGLGDTGAGWAGIAPQFAQQLPGVKWVFPTAAERPITVNMGMRMTGWFDIVSLDDIDQRQDEQGLRDSVRLVEKLVKEEQAQGIDKVVVAGFSQGGAIALLMLRSDVKLAGVAGLSTWLTLPGGPLVSAANKQTPLWMAHGTADQVVRFVYGARSYEALKEAGVDASFMQIPGMGHSADPDELDSLQAWLGKVLS